MDLKKGQVSKTDVPALENGLLPVPSSSAQGTESKRFPCNGALIEWPLWRTGQKGNQMANTFGLSCFPNGNSGQHFLVRKYPTRSVSLLQVFGMSLACSLLLSWFFSLVAIAPSHFVFLEAQGLCCLEVCFASLKSICLICGVTISCHWGWLEEYGLEMSSKSRWPPAHPKGKQPYW